MPGPQSQECSPGVARSRQEGNHKRSNIPLNDSRRNDLADKKRKKEEKRRPQSHQSGRRRAGCIHAAPLSHRNEPCFRHPSQDRKEKQERVMTRKTKKEEGKLFYAQTPRIPSLGMLSSRSFTPTVLSQTKQRRDQQARKTSAWGTAETPGNAATTRNRMYTFWGVVLCGVLSRVYFLFWSGRCRSLGAAVLFLQRE
ncbi:uncharacterized protein J3D65DRAFT_75212 [Phyllosticta citribraziliensis]|uniref:Uncharacterized protein n=1 Tax=Phyllosticta citribraziliensis TaxID=989973 RepID=A0ABR1LEW9_9PEZI